MNAEDFQQQPLPLEYKTKTIKRLDPLTYVFHCTTRNDAGGRCNRNMVVIASTDKAGADLTIVDPLKVTSEGERKLLKLGTVTQIVRLGSSMHSSEEDAYYLSAFPKCQRWAPGEFLSDLTLNLPLHVILKENGAIPFPECKVFCFRDTAIPEAAILLLRQDSKHGNVLITGDCLQHQIDNEFVNMPVVAKFKLAGLLESDIVVSQQWLKKTVPPSSATTPKKASSKGRGGGGGRPRMRRMSSLSGNQKAIRGDFMRMLGLDFQRMVSTSGNVVKYGAKKSAVLAVEYAFPLWERSNRNMGTNGYWIFEYCILKILFLEE